MWVAQDTFEEKRGGEGQKEQWRLQLGAHYNKDNRGGCLLVFISNLLLDCEGREQAKGIDVTLIYSQNLHT